MATNTATTSVTHTGNGSTNDFAIPFSFLADSEIDVTVAGVLKTINTHYTISGSTVTFTSGNTPDNNAAIKFQRDTDISAKKVDFSDGSVLTEVDLDTSNDQIIFAQQEITDKVNGIEEGATADQTAAEIRTLVESASDSNVFNDADHSKLNGIEDNATRDQTITEIKSLIAGSPLDASHLAANSVDSSELVDGSIDTSHYASGSIDATAIGNAAVQTAKIADTAVSTAKIADTAVTTAKLANDSVTTAKIVDGSVNTARLADNAVTTDKIADANVTGAKIAANVISNSKMMNDSITSAEIADNAVITQGIANTAVTNAKLATDSVTTPKIADDAVTNAKIADGTLDGRYYTETELDAGQLDNRYYTEAESDARYFNVSTGDTIKDGDTFPDNDTTIATTAAINDRIIDLVDDVGGFVPIANETSFPTANPDAENGTGTIVSVKAASTNLTPSGTTVTIANGAGTGNTVTITGVPSVIPSGFGFLVETTTNTHEYTFHRLVPKATEVTTVAGISSNVSTVAGISSNVTAVANNATNINAVAGNNSNITAVAGNSSNINSAVSNASNINSVVSNATNINTVAGSITNVNNVGGSISNVNSVANNLSSVNSFANTYRIGSSNPTDSLDVGDLFFNTTANELKVYNGSSWQSGVTATGNFAVTTGNTFTGSNNHNDNVKSIYGTGSDLEIYHDGSNSFIKDTGTGGLKIMGSDLYLRNPSDEDMIYATSDGAVNLYYDNSKKFETHPNGVLVTGHIYAADNKKILLGNSADLEIFHDGSNSFIKDVGTGALSISGSQVSLDSSDLSEYMIKAVENAQVEAYYDGSKKFETTSTGANLYGHLLPATTETHDLGSNAKKWSELHLKHYLYMPDDGRIRLGSSYNMQLFYNGSHQVLLGKTGITYITCPSGQSVRLNKSSADNFNAEQMVTAYADGAVELYYDNVKKLYTYADGAKVEGDFVFKTAGGVTKASWSGTEDRIKVNDNTKFIAGDGNDLQIFHDGTSNLIRNVGTSDMYINLNTTEVAAKFTANGNVELYHDNSKKFETTSIGVTITGDLSFSGASARAIRLGDNERIYLGDDEDAYIGSNGGNAEIVGSFFYYNHQLYYDNVRLRLGNSQDLDIFHNGSHSFIDNNTGDLNIESSAVLIKANNTENSVSCLANGAVELYYDNSKKFETTSTGVQAARYSFDSDNYITCNTSANTMEIVTNSTDIGEFSPAGLMLRDNMALRVGTGSDLRIFHDGSNNYIKGVNNDLIYIATNNVNRWYFANDGHFRPEADNSYDIGSASQRVRNIYTGDLNLSNEGSSNDVDGTWGSYTIQEGAEDLFLINKRSGKKYKFALAEVS